MNTDNETYFDFGWCSYCRVGRVSVLELFGRWKRVSVVDKVHWERIP